MNETLVWIILVWGAVAQTVALILIWQTKNSLTTIYSHNAGHAANMSKTHHVLENLTNLSAKTVESMDKMLSSHEKASWENDNAHMQINRKLDDMAYLRDGHHDPYGVRERRDRYNRDVPPPHDHLGRS